LRFPAHGLIAATDLYTIKRTKILQNLISGVHSTRYYGFINAGAATTGVDVAASSQAISSGEKKQAITPH